MAKQTPPPVKPSLLETQKGGLTFPCEFVIKVFGLASDEFNTTVLTLVRKHQPNLSESAIQSKSSKEGKYSALSILVYVYSQEQLDAIYRELTADSSVLMAL